MSETNKHQILAGQEAYDLYKRGREAWNDWAGQHAGWRVDFMGWDFPNEEFLDFGFFHFPGGALFIEANFGDGGVSFYKANFGDGGVDFYKASFGDGPVNFTGATFGDGGVYFYKATFCDGRVDFSGATFGNRKGVKSFG